MKGHESFFKSFDGLELYVQVWYPDGSPRSAVGIVHGGFEHSGRYSWLASYLAEQGYAVFAFDLRGHGRSPGERGFIANIDDALRDVQYFIDFILAHSPELPLFLLAHSAGGLLTCEVMMARPSDRVRGVILSGPALKLYSVNSSPSEACVFFLGSVLPRLRILMLDAKYLSHDPDVVEAYRRDPLVFKAGASARVLAELLRASKRVQGQFEQARFPMLILHGSDDRFADVRGSKELYERSCSRDKTLRIYQDCYHEVLNETCKGIVVRDMLNWIEERE
jgi:alpha-beta hydrolase superfamily lysophospholipase